jgi:RNA polymerase sigma-70 factor (ECF subfamily)
MDGFVEGAENQLLGSDVVPEDAVNDAGFDADVEAALASLPEKFRVAVVLCDIEGLSYDEIADVLGVKVGTVRSRIHRGRMQLRDALAHRAPSRGRTRFLGPVGV